MLLLYYWQQIDQNNINIYQILVNKMWITKHQSNILLEMRLFINLLLEIEFNINSIPIFHSYWFKCQEICFI